MNIKNSKFIALTLALFMLGTIFSISVFAGEDYLKDKIRKNSILLETNNPEVGIEIYASTPKLKTTFRYDNTSATESGRFYLTSDNSTLSEFKTTGKFTYDGEICNVIDCKNSVWNVADGWRVKNETSENQVSPTLAKAVGTFELYKEGFLGDKLSSSATITISCTHKGKTNTEFNGDE